MNGKGKFTLVQLNDSHGYLDLHQELFWQGDHAVYRKAGGFARLTALMNRIRQEAGGDILALDNGDTFHGTYPVVSTQGDAMIPVIRHLGLDAMTAHWDFAYGPARLKEIASEIGYPVLANNVYEDSTDRLFFEPTLIKEISGLRIGVIGIAATIVDKVMPRHFSEGIHLTLGKEELPGIIDHLRQDEKVDVVVVLSHLGFPQEVQMAKVVNGIDVLLSGHTHNRIYQPVVENNTLIIQSGSHGTFLGRLDLEVDGRRVVNYSHQLMEAKESLEPDREVQTLVQNIIHNSDVDLGEVVGETATDLNRNTVLEATMDNLLLKSLLDATGAQLAFSNGWRYGAPIPKGEITVNDLWNIVPVNPPVSMVDLSGAELRAMMEENLERTFACNPYDQMGGYVKRSMGLNLYFKVESPPTHRITDLFVGGERVQDERRYAATFITTQGVPAKYGENREQLDVKTIDVMKNYIKKNKKVHAEIEGAIVAV